MTTIARRPVLVALCLTVLAGQGAAQTPDWQADNELCKRLTGRGGGLFIVYPQGFAPGGGARNGLPGDRHFMRVNGGAVPYHPQARFYFIPNGGGVTVPAGGEAVWSVRTESVEAPQKAEAERVRARHVRLWRPGIRTACRRQKGRGALDQFDSFSRRDITLRRFAQHHPHEVPDSWSRSAALRDRLHFEVEADCKPTDDPAIAGPNLWTAYGFEKIPDDPDVVDTLFASRARAEPSIGRGAEQRAAYTMEFTIVAPEKERVTACFGFSVPAPVDAWFGVFSVDWHPHRTDIRIRRVRSNGSVGGGTLTHVNWIPRTQ